MLIPRTSITPAGMPMLRPSFVASEMSVIESASVLVGEVVCRGVLGVGAIVGLIR